MTIFVDKEREMLTTMAMIIHCHGDDEEEEEADDDDNDECENKDT